MTEVFIKTTVDETPDQNEIAFHLLLWAINRVDSSDVRKLLIEAIAKLARDD